MWGALIPMIGGGLLSAGGSILQGQGADQSNRAMYGPNGPLASERYRQANFTREAQGITDRELARFDNFQGQMDTGAKSVADFFKANSAPLPTSGPTSGVVPVSTSRAVQLDAAPRFAKVAAYNDQQGGALAKLRSFGDLLGAINRNLGIDRQDLANISSFRAGSRALLPFEMDIASHAGDGTRRLGELLSGIGRIGMSFGQAGGFGKLGGLFGGGAGGGGTAP